MNTRTLSCVWLTLPLCYHPMRDIHPHFGVAEQWHRVFLDAGFVEFCSTDFFVLGRATGGQQQHDGVYGRLVRRICRLRSTALRPYRDGSTTGCPRRTGRVGRCARCRTTLPTEPGRPAIACPAWRSSDLQAARICGICASRSNCTSKGEMFGGFGKPASGGFCHAQVIVPQVRYPRSESRAVPAPA